MAFLENFYIDKEKANNYLKAQRIESILKLNGFNMGRTTFH
jgi:hypothetical protein